jgi:hypothetical protein
MSGIAVAGALGTPLAQAKGTEVERAGQDLDVQQHAVRSGEKSDSAAGVGETDGEDHQTDDRDADGRLPWRIPASQKKAPAADAAAPPPPSPKDTTGQSGNLLDVSG